MRASKIYVVLSAFLQSSFAAYSTDFAEILLAHAEPTICPTASMGASGGYYEPDEDYIICCPGGIPEHTRTTAKGQGGKTVYACCESGSICTGAAPVMRDWSIDANGEIQTLDLSNPPMPSQGATAATTPNANVAVTTAPPSLTTVSTPGATPYTTSAGVVFYITNENNNNVNNGDNNQNNGSIEQHKNDASLDGGAIAGITVACTIISTICAVLGVWYARRRKRRNAEKEDAEKLESQASTSAAHARISQQSPEYQQHGLSEMEAQTERRY